MRKKKTNRAISTMTVAVFFVLLCFFCFVYVFLFLFFFVLFCFVLFLVCFVLFLWCDPEFWDRNAYCKWLLRVNVLQISLEVNGKKRNKGIGLEIADSYTFYRSERPSKIKNLLEKKRIKWICRCVDGVSILKNFDSCLSVSNLSIVTC